MIREDFLQQSAFHEIDSFCSLDKQYWMLKVILGFHEMAKRAMNRGTGIDSIMQLPVKKVIGRMKELPDAEMVREHIDRISRDFASLMEED